MGLAVAKSDYVLCGLFSRCMNRVAIVLLLLLLPNRNVAKETSGYRLTKVWRTEG